jgi:hypothetical protein
VSYLGIIDSSEHVELPPELILLLLLLLLIQFFVRINWGDLNGERLDLFMLFSHGFRRLNRGVIVAVLVVVVNLCGGTFINRAVSNDLKAPAEVFDDIVVDDEKLKTFVFDIFTLFCVFFNLSFFLLLFKLFSAGNNAVNKHFSFLKKLFPHFEIFC